MPKRTAQHVHVPTATIHDARADVLRRRVDELARAPQSSGNSVVSELEGAAMPILATNSGALKAYCVSLMKQHEQSQGTILALMGQLQRSQATVSSLSQECSSLRRALQHLEHDIQNATGTLEHLASSSSAEPTPEVPKRLANVPFGGLSSLSSTRGLGEAPLPDVSSMLASAGLGALGPGPSRSETSSTDELLRSTSPNVPFGGLSSLRGTLAGLGDPPSNDASGMLSSAGLPLGPAAVRADGDSSTDELFAKLLTDSPNLTAHWTEDVFSQLLSTVDTPSSVALRTFLDEASPDALSNASPGLKGAMEVSAAARRAAQLKSEVMSTQAAQDFRRTKAPAEPGSSMGSSSASWMSAACV